MLTDHEVRSLVGPLIGFSGRGEIQYVQEHLKRKVKRIRDPREFSTPFSTISFSHIHD